MVFILVSGASSQDRGEMANAALSGGVINGQDGIQM
jgi:hypothetical protein